jgi:hypothetical protein
MSLSLNQDVFCACSLDILEYSVKEVRSTDYGTFYVLRSKKPVGQHRFIELLLAEGSAGILRYIELDSTDADDCEYGLEPFTHGTYHTTLEAAKSAFAREQILLIESRETKVRQELEELARRKAKWATMLLV